MTDTTVPQRIRARREYLNIDQATLAKAIGRSRTTITAMEMGRTVITTEHLDAFAKVLRVDPAYFYGENEAPPHPVNLADEASKLVAALSPTGQKYALAMLRGILASEIKEEQPDGEEEPI